MKFTQACAQRLSLSGSRRVSGRGLAGRGCGDAALRYRHTETHIFPAANLAPKVSRDPQTWSEKTKRRMTSSRSHAPASSLRKARQF
ncbi:unnamed protein product [Pieris brassicae]|uniref:Uncharacterized protein n=1 Tax=Pieris brassicae TaxID=7116 RepID=A0A9P0XHS5_PIEBR|nr:unnamed protein product [Pieris brassicae]